ncbi:G2/M phase-specific E3 ubiquitin-protein ligase-like [Cebidichthys violaceus]|uniref:G2/M phase-specific E3 ubiquitin-protein ligase-like n=1 Tax=Cebidichthys violaceus TaxID=271503 RepID=UPI0035CBEB47
MDLISCEEDVIRWVRSQVDSSKTFEICVSRDNMVERGLKLWKRKKNGSPVNPLRITFLGEPGIDTGALKKEFLSTMVAGIEKRLFEGESERGKMPKYSLNDLDDELFRTAGEVFAVSIAQGGPAPRFMQEWLPLL